MTYQSRPALRSLCIRHMAKHEPLKRVALTDSQLQIRPVESISPVFGPRDASIALDDVDNCCALLFERWCERRCVVPLAYLMRVWPMADPGSHQAQRLLGALRDLLRFNAEMLDANDRRLIRHALAAAGEAAQF